MNRSLKLSILAALALSSIQAMALGLGQIRVKSALNKPLVAEIPLQLDYPGEANQLAVTLASTQEFARAGLDRASLTVPLEFKVTTNAAGQKVIRITSKEPVRESFLDFLVKVEWPQGQLLREYTVLLDPPGMVATSRLQGAVAPAKAPAPAPAPARPVMTPKPAPAAKATPAPAPAAPAAAAPARKAPKPVATTRAPAPAPSVAATPSAAVGSGQYGPVARGQSLWGIARKVRSADVSVNQMMVALKAANPDAFYKDNINALRSGAVLRIPTRDQLQATSKAAATAQVLRQDRDWQAVAPRRPAMVGRAGAGTTNKGAARRTAAATATGSGSNAASGDHLRLVPPSHGGESTGARAGVANGSSKVMVRKLSDELARTRESLSSTQQQTADLEARLKSLRDIQDKNDRLLSLKNAEIAELQRKLAQANRPAAAASTAMPATHGSMARTASTVPAASAASVTAAAVAATVAKPAAGSSAAAIQQPVKPVKSAKPTAATQVARQAGQQPWYTTLWAKAGALVVLLLALLGLLLRGRGGKKSPTGASGSSLADQFGDSPFGDLPGQTQDDEEQDALLHHLAEHPDDIESHLELVSLYYARRDVERFEAAAEAMHAHVDDESLPEWQDVLTMGEELSPDYPLFAGVAHAYDPQIPDEESASPHAESGPEVEEDASKASTSEAAFELPQSQGAYDAPSEEDYDALPPLPDEEDSVVPAEDLAALEEFGHGEDDEDLVAVPPDVPKQDQDDAGSVHGMDDDLDLAADDGEDAAPETPRGLGVDAVDTKIDLARAYIDMGDPEGARAMLEEALAEGSDAQREVAQKLLDELD